MNTPIKATRIPIIKWLEPGKKLEVYLYMVAKKYALVKTVRHRLNMVPMITIAEIACIKNIPIFFITPPCCLSSIAITPIYPGNIESKMIDIITLLFSK